MYFQRNLPPAPSILLNPYTTRVPTPTLRRPVPSRNPPQNHPYSLHDHIRRAPPNNSRSPSPDEISEIPLVIPQSSPRNPDNNLLLTPPSRTSRPTFVNHHSKNKMSDSTPPRALTETIRLRPNIQPRSLFEEDDSTNENVSASVPLQLQSKRNIDQFKALFNYHHTYKNRYNQTDRHEAKLSTSNLASNHPWGDVLQLVKPPRVFRLYYQNVNGVKMDASGGDLLTICPILHMLSCDIVGLCETKLDTSKYSVRQSISKSFRSQFRSVRYSASTSAIPFDGYYKPGGTMTVCTDSSVSRFNDKFEDPIGRWSTISLNGKRGRIIHFVTLYQVVDKIHQDPSQRTNNK